MNLSIIVINIIILTHHQKKKEMAFRTDAKYDSLQTKRDNRNLIGNFILQLMQL